MTQYSPIIMCEEYQDVLDIQNKDDLLVILSIFLSCQRRADDAGSFLQDLHAVSGI